MSAMTEISYLWPLTGGLLIGLSAGLYLLLNGRIAGISGLAAAAAGVTHCGCDGLRHPPSHWSLAMRTRTLAAIVCGLIFGAGLAISDMINPGRVLVPRCRG